MSTLLEQLQNRLDNLNARIADIDADITTLQAETGGSSDVMAALASQIARLTSVKTNIESRKTNIQEQIDQINANWSAEEQTIVDAIDTLFDGEYHSIIQDNLKSNSTPRRAEFFALYAGATTDCQRRWIIKYFFNL